VEDASDELLKLWMKYEEIAMHFNDLLIRLRTQTLGGAATIVTAAGFLTSRQSTPAVSEPWGAVAAVSILLLLAWVTIGIIDFYYYSKLLRGAVVGLIEIEKLSKGRIKFSHRVEQVVSGSSDISLSDLENRTDWKAILFYSPIAVFLAAAVGVSVYLALR
jgi:hypothetical protein